MANVNVLIAFYSRNGSTEALPQAIAERALTEGGEVRLRRAREVVSEQVMSKAPGWLENATRMNQQYEAPKCMSIPLEGCGSRKAGRQGGLGVYVQLNATR